MHRCNQPRQFVRQFGFQPLPRPNGKLQDGLSLPGNDGAAGGWLTRIGDDYHVQSVESHIGRDVLSAVFGRLCSLNTVLSVDDEHLPRGPAPQQHIRPRHIRLGASVAPRPQDGRVRVSVVVDLVVVPRKGKGRLSQHRRGLGQAERVGEHRGDECLIDGVCTFDVAEPGQHPLGRCPPEPRGEIGAQAVRLSVSRVNGFLCLPRCGKGTHWRACCQRPSERSSQKPRCRLSP